MQVDPNAATVVYVNTPRGGELTLDPGREVVARVVSAAGDGTAKISLAGQTLDVTSDAPLRVGDEVRLAVTRADAAGVRLAIVTPDASAGAGAGTAAGRGMQGLVGELARAGVPVTPQLAHAVATVAEQLGGGSTAARAVASLAGRDLALSPGAATRVAAALDLAGSLGPALSSLAGRSPEVAAALPSGPPNAAALRALLAPGLAASEVAVARIVQAAQAAAPNGPVTLPTPPSSSAAVIQNYVASQVAITTRLDDLASANTLLGTNQLLAARGQLGAGQGAAAGLAQDALHAALRGQAAATQPAGAGAAQAASNAPRTAAPAPVGAAPTASAQAAQQAATANIGSAKANASAAAATGAAHAAAMPTNARAAQAVADLANLAVRFAPAVAPGGGAIGTVTTSVARGMSAVEVAQQQAVATTAGRSVAGAGAGGDPAPLVAAIQRYLASPGAEGDAARMLRALSGASPTALATAIGTLPESHSLQLAGRLLDLLPASGQLSGPAMHDLRAGVHAALDQLGRALVPPGSDDVTVLRAALEHVASNDPRPAVANDAARLLAAADGQQILSRTAAGADPGYVYFQVPMPGGRGAEVLVRRDPARRQVTFDEFNIAFLLDTEQVGTLMIQLDAHPAGIRADVLTDLPALEPYLRARTEELIEPLARESRRPVIVTTGVFEQDPPASLLEPTLGAVEPGATEFYA